MKEPDGVPQTALLYFDQSLRGLQPGATVDFRGVVLGEVKSIGVEYDRERREFRMPVLVQIYPDRLGVASTKRPARSAAPTHSCCACWSSAACVPSCATATC
jgi:paraquat-inducible protein B